MKCTSCKQEVAAVFRTGPLGESPEWMCRPCIIERHDASLIDEETQEIVNALTQTQDGILN